MRALLYSLVMIAFAVTFLALAAEFVIDGKRIVAAVAFAGFATAVYFGLADKERVNAVR